MIPDGIGSWATLPFFGEVWPEISRIIDQEFREILPPSDLRFAALARTQPSNVKVVILGQDPYPTPGHANGLAFSVTPETALPKSLKNIFIELENDVGSRPDNGDLGHWADQGVLLVNTALTVPAGQAGGHANIGWDFLIREALELLSDRSRVFVLWGKHAQGFQRHIKGDDHLILASPHPSPLSAYRGFFGSRPFSKANAWLRQRGQAEINWA